MPIRPDPDPQHCFHSLPSKYRQNHICHRERRKALREEDEHYGRRGQNIQLKKNENRKKDEIRLASFD
jgi:hypothetical protein